MRQMNTADLRIRTLHESKGVICVVDDFDVCVDMVDHLLQTLVVPFNDSCKSVAEESIA